MTADKNGFTLNARGGFNEQFLVANTVNALRLLSVPVSVAIFPKGRHRLYFLGDRPIVEEDKRAIIAAIEERFGLVTTLNSLTVAIKHCAPAMPPERLQRWRDANNEALRARNAAHARNMRLARDPSLAERRADAAVERMAENARKREDQKAERAAKALIASIANESKPSREEWFAGLRWDRRNRIQTFLATTAGASSAHSLVFAQWLACAAHRCIEPGAPAFGVALRGVSELDAIAVLEALAGPWLGISLAPDAQPSQLRTQVSDRLIVHTSARDRREPDIFAILAARVEDTITDSSEPVPRTFALACTLADDEAVPHGFREVRVTGFDADALRRDRDQLFAEARECALAAIAKDNSNEIVRRKRLAWESRHAG